jgi:hypothetical protein
MSKKITATFSITYDVDEILNENPEFVNPDEDITDVEDYVKGLFIEDLDNLSNETYSLIEITLGE